MIHNNRVDKLDFLKMSNICPDKGIIKRMNRQVIDWEKIFVNCMSSIVVVSRISKELFLIQQ